MSVNPIPKERQRKDVKLSPTLVEYLKRFRDSPTMLRDEAKRLNRDLEGVEQPIIANRKLIRLLEGEPFQYKQLEIRLRNHYKLRNITEFTAQRVIRQLLELGIIGIRGQYLERNRENKGNRWNKVTLYELTEIGEYIAHPISYPPIMDEYDSLPSALQEINPIPKQTILDVK